MGFLEDLIADAAIAIGGAAIGAVAGVVAAVIIFKIVDVVAEKISKYNIPRLIRNAIRNSKSKKAKELLARAIGNLHGMTSNVSDHEVSIFLFDEEEKKVGEVKLHSEAGVSESVVNDMKMKI